MRINRLHILSLSLLMVLLSAVPIHAQETLKASRIQVKGARRHLPSLGLPRKAEGGIDGIIQFASPVWTGRDAEREAPRWSMIVLSPGDDMPDGIPQGIVALCKQWILDSPRGKLSIVFGPHGEDSFVALCKKSSKSLGWKSIGFILPKEMEENEGSIYRYSMSVNRLERLTGYDFFPRLPSHLQEIIEEMTSSELLSPVQEFDRPEADGIEREREWDMEEDYREMG